MTHRRRGWPSSGRPASTPGDAAAGSSRSCRSRGSPPARRGRRRRARRPGSRPSRPSPRESAPPCAPSAATMPAVERTSAPSPAPSIRLSPSARAASISARWLTDLSPGRRSSPRRRAAVRTRATSVAEPGAVVALNAWTARLGCRPTCAGDLPRRRIRRGRLRAEPRTCSWTGTIAAIRSPEPVEVELLLGVGQRVVGMRMDLDHDPVGADRDAADRQRLDQPALAGGVARIDDDGQVGQLVEQRHRRQVHRVAGVRLERPDAALAQDHVRVARADDVLGGHQPLLDRRAVAALEHHRAGDPSDVAQERVVLHVPGADLEDVGVLGDDVDLVRLHHLGDDRQARPLARLGEVAQRLDAEPLEGVRAGPRLERAAAQDRGAGGLDRVGRLEELVAALDRARARPSSSATRRRSTASRTRMTVSSGWNSRDVSLNGRLIGVTGVDAGQRREAARAAPACAPRSRRRPR